MTAWPIMSSPGGNGLPAGGAARSFTRLRGEEGNPRAEQMFGGGADDLFLRDGVRGLRFFLSTSQKIPASLIKLNSGFSVSVLPSAGSRNRGGLPFQS